LKKYGILPIDLSLNEEPRGRLQTLYQDKKDLLTENIAL
jgi:hypothetical protein